MFGSKSIFGILICLILLFGCVNNQSQVETKKSLSNDISSTNSSYAESTISVRGDDNVSVVRVNAIRSGTIGWKFPLIDYQKPFELAGLYSDSFIELNNSQVLSLNQNETIWLTPLIKSGNRTILFNAVYRTYIPNENTKEISILGKNYSVDYLFSRQEKAFESDDKWKVAIISNQEKIWSSNLSDQYPMQIIIYLDGYFSDLNNSEAINLFRNDNSILFRFDRILGNDPTLGVYGDTPYFEVIGTKPLSPVSSKVVKSNNSHTVIGYSGQNITYSQSVSVGMGGISINFEPAIPMFIDHDYLFDNLLENHVYPFGENSENLSIIINGTTWNLARIRANGSVLSTEQGTADSSIYSIRNNLSIKKDEIGFSRNSETPFNLTILGKCENIAIDNETYQIEIGIGQVLLDKNFSDCNSWSYYINRTNGILFSQNDNIKKINNKWVRLIVANPIDAGVAVFIISDDFASSNELDGVEFVWQQNFDNASRQDCTISSCRYYNESFLNQKLKSVFIPSSSELYRELLHN